MQSINGSNITLVPKKRPPSVVGDYRAISLLNTSVKVLTKLLANHLQRVITKLVHKNQYGFIKERSIQDCLAWSFKYLYHYKKTRNEMVILMLDFKKTFDKLKHEAITDILCHKGFRPRWMKWITMIMNSRMSEVLLNGVPGKRFHCKHGVRQGDPLSLLLFVMAADLLQTIVNKQRILVFFGSLFRLVADKIFPLYNMQMTRS
jgi:retron-type reverse transcriptase